jgi:hypothetical protein
VGTYGRKGSEIRNVWGNVASGAAVKNERQIESDRIGGVSGVCNERRNGDVVIRNGKASTIGVVNRVGDFSNKCRRSRRRGRRRPRRVRNVWATVENNGSKRRII